MNFNRPNRFSVHPRDLNERNFELWTGYDDYEFINRQFKRVEGRSGGRFDLDDWLIDQDPHPQCSTDRLSYLGLGTFNLTTFEGFCLPPAYSKPPVAWTSMDYERAMHLFPCPAKIEHAVIYGYFVQALQWDEDDEQEFIARWNYWSANPVEDPEETLSSSSEEEEEDDVEEEDADDSFDSGGIADEDIVRLQLAYGESPESIDGSDDEEDIRSPPVKRQRLQIVRSLSC